MRNDKSGIASIAPEYTLARFSRCFEADFEILLPGQMKDTLQAWDKERQQQAIQQEKDMDATEDQNKNDTKISENAGEVKEVIEESSRLIKYRRRFVQESEIWKKIDSNDDQCLNKSVHRVFNSRNALALFDRFASGTTDSSERYETIYADIVKRGTTLRKMGYPASSEKLIELRHLYPHFKEVVDFFVEQLAIAHLSLLPRRIPPILLLGPAGIGKSHFCGALANALSTSIYERSLDSDLTNSMFLGSDSKWSNSAHGLVFDALILGEYANPIFLIDELDKSHRSLSYGSPLSSLHSLLEQQSAKSVRDISLDFQIDARFVTWIALANDIALLDTPLRSRFRIFKIDFPTAENCLLIAEQVMRSAISSSGIENFSDDVSMRRHIAHLSAREVWHATDAAIARAVFNNRKHLILEDFPEELTHGEDKSDVIVKKLLH